MALYSHCDILLLCYCVMLFSLCDNYMYVTTSILWKIKMLHTAKKKFSINPYLVITTTSLQQPLFCVVRWLLWRSLTVIETMIP